MPVFTSITPLPASASREVVLAFLHDYEAMVDLNPLVIERHRIPPPRNADPDEASRVWYQLTDAIAMPWSSTPTASGGKSRPKSTGSGGTNVSYTCVFHPLPNGLQTHCRAPLGVDIRDRWTLGGTQPGEPRQPLELGLDALGAPATGLYLREDVDLRCNRLMAGFVKKTLKKSHSTLVDRLASLTAATSQDGKAKKLAESAKSDRTKVANGGSSSNSSIKNGQRSSYSAPGTSRGAPQVQPPRSTPSPPTNKLLKRPAYAPHPPPPKPYGTPPQLARPPYSQHQYAHSYSHPAQAAPPPLRISNPRAAAPPPQRSYQAYRPGAGLGAAPGKKSKTESAAAPVSPVSPVASQPSLFVLPQRTYQMPESKAATATSQQQQQQSDASLYPHPLRLQRSAENKENCPQQQQKQQQSPSPPPSLTHLDYPAMNPYDGDNGTDESPILSLPKTPVFAELAGTELQLVPVVLDMGRSAKV